MKKKIGDLTLREIYKECLKHDCCIGECPLFASCLNCHFNIMIGISKELDEDVVIEEEIEVEDDDKN